MIEQMMRKLFNVIYYDCPIEKEETIIPLDQMRFIIKKIHTKLNISFELCKAIMQECFETLPFATITKNKYNASSLNNFTV